MSADNRTKLYNALKSEGYTDIGSSQEEFNGLMENPKNLRLVYDALKTSGYTDIGKDYTEFEELINPHYNPIAAQNPQAFAPEGEEIKPEQIVNGNTPTLKDTNRFQVSELSSRIEGLTAKRNKEIEEENRRAEEATPWYARAMKNMARGGIGGAPTYAVTNNGRLNDNEYMTLQAAAKSMRNAQNIIAEADHNAKEGRFTDWLERSFAGGAVRGLGKTLYDPHTWDMGVLDVAENSALLKALDAYEAGDSLTEAQQALLDAKAVELATNAYFGSEVGRGYKAGQVTAEAIPFMLEMAINPASTSGKGAVNALTRYALKRFGTKAAKKGLSTAAKVATRVVGDVAGASAMAATTGAGNVAANTLERMAGDARFATDAAGRSSFAGTTNRENPATALAKSFGATTIENYSEMLGEYFAPVFTPIGKGLAKGLDKMKLGAVNRFIDDVKMSDIGRFVSDFEKQTQWSGVAGEYSEEVVGGVINALTVGDQTLDTDENTGVFNLEKNIETLTSVALMGGFMSSVKTLGYRTPVYRAQKQIDYADNAGQKMFEDWGDIKNKLDNDRSSLPFILMGANPEQRKVILDYYAALCNYNGVLRGKAKQEAEGDNTVNNSYDAGYATTDAQGMSSIKKTMEGARAAISFLSNEAVQRLDENPIPTLELMESEGATDEELQAVRDYVNASAAYKGMVQRVRDDMESRVEDSNAIVESRINRTTGLIQGATMKQDDRRVYVINGNIVQYADGSGIDKNASDKSIIVRDAETGALEQVSPDAILNIDEALDPITEMQTAAEVIRQQYAQEVANRIDGVVTSTEEAQQASTTQPVAAQYNYNDEVTILDDNNQPVRATIASNADGDGRMQVETETPVNGKRVNYFTAEEINGRLYEAPGESQQKEQSAPTKEAIPMEKVGKEERPAYHLVPFERTLEELHGDADLTQQDIDAFITANITELQKRNAELESSELQEAYNAPGSVEGVTTPDEVVAGLLGSIKITPESFKRETGLSTAEQKGLVGIIANEDKGGVSVERAAEIIAENYGDELAASGYTGDVQGIRDMIISVLSDGNPRTYAKRGAEQRTNEEAEERRREIEAWVAQFDMTVEEYFLYEQTMLPRVMRDYQGFDENEYYSILADEYNDYNYDTERESESVGRGREVLQGEQPVPARGAEPVGAGNEGGAVPSDVQGGTANGANEQAQSVNSFDALPREGDLGAANGVAQEEIGQPVGISEQLSGSEIPNSSTVSQESEQVGEQENEISEDGKTDGDASLMMQQIAEEKKRLSVYANRDLKQYIKNIESALPQLVYNANHASEQDFEKADDELKKWQIKLAAAKELLGERDNGDWKSKFGVNLSYNKELSIGNVKTLFENLNEDEAVGKLFDKVYKVVERLGLKIKISDQLSTATGSAGTDGIVKFAAALFYAPYTNQSRATTLLHELIHTTTMYATALHGVRNKGGVLTEMYNNLPQEIKDACVELERIYNLIKDNKEVAGEYGITSVNEMVAELANVEFRTKMKKIGLWERFVNAVKRLFDFPIKTDAEQRVSDALSEAERVLDTMLDNFDKTSYDAIIEKLKAAGLGRKRRISSFAELQQGDLPLERENPAFKEATERTVEQLKKVAPVEIATEEQARAMGAFGFSTTKEEFKARAQAAKEQAGIVAYGLNGQELPIMQVEKHSFTGNLKNARQEAKSWAENNFVGKEYDMPEGGGNYIITKRAIGKYIDKTAVEKSENPGVHLSALVKLPEIISNSVDAEIHPDYNRGEDGVRRRENGIGNEDMLVHRLYGAIEIDGKVYRVKTTMHEFLNGNDANSPHSYEVTQIELIEDSTVAPTNEAHNPLNRSTNSISATKLLNGVEKSYDKGKKLLDESKGTPEMMTVYHGSGAKFNRFDHSFMGTGEGAQAFGWGTYVTEVEGIGKQYAEAGNPAFSSLRAKIGNIDAALHSLDLDVERANRELEQNSNKSAKERAKYIIENAKYRREALYEERASVEKEMSKLGRNLYTVEIPNDNGSNYLHWDKRITDAQKTMLSQTAENEGVVFDFYGDKVAAEEYFAKMGEGIEGFQLYKALERALGSDKAASEFLGRAGFVGIRYTADRASGVKRSESNYVIFNESDARITDRVEFFRTANGTVYGWAVNGKVYLTPDGINPNTPVHEYTHLWASVMEKNNPEEWAKIVEGLKASPVWNEVLADEGYREIWNNDNRVASEVLSRLAGRENYRREMERAQREIDNATNPIEAAERITFRESVKQAVQRFWDNVKRLFQKVTGKAGEGSWKDFVEMPLRDFWAGVKPEATGSPLDRMFIGEQGAANLDKAQEATTRLDNLSVAREMEAAGKEAKVIKLATGWERGADGKWRYEVEDALIKETPMQKVARLKEEYKPIDKEFDRLNNATAVPLRRGASEAEKSRRKEINKQRAKVAKEWSKKRGEIWGAEQTARGLTVAELIGEDNELLKMYPELTDMQVSFVNNTDFIERGYNGFYDGSSIWINPNAENANRVFTHEIQHAIQEIEGFARGSNVERFADVRGAVLDSLNFMTNGDLLKGSAISDVQSLRDALDKNIPYTEMSVKEGYAENLQKVANKYGYENIDALVEDFANMPSAFEQYRRTAGEVESRNVQARMDMTAEERRNSLAAETEDVARKDQVFIYENLGTSAAEERDVYSREGYGPASDSEMATESDVYAKALGRPRYTGRKMREYVAGQRQKMVERAKELAEKLHLDNVEVVTDASTLEGKKQRAKGFYTKSTGKITIVIPNHSSVADVEQTLLHEAVAHYGLRQLFGESFDTFLDNVYYNASEEIRAEIDRLTMEKYDGETRTATEEYLASLAENTNFENAERSSWWQKIKRFFVDMLAKAGVKLDAPLTDNELRYILWRSYENLAEPGRYRSIIGEAADIAKQYDLGVGNYAPVASGDMVAERDVLNREGTPATGTASALYENAVRRKGGKGYQEKVAITAHKLQEAYQDSMLALDELQKAITAETGNTIETYEDAYMAENAMSSRNRAEIEAFERDFYNPLIAAVGQLVNSGASYDDVKTYMHAKHGLERNRVFSKRDVENAGNVWDGEVKRDYSGLTALTGEKTVKALTAKAEHIVAEFEANHDTEELWRRINTATKQTLRKGYESGMMNRETYERVRDMFEYYIPLRGWDTDVAADEYEYLNSPRPMLPPALKTAEGRKSISDDPVATIAFMANAEIVRGNRNVMKQHFFNLVLNNPTSVATVSEQWYTYNNAKEEWNPDNPVIPIDATADEIDAILKEHEQKMRELQEQGLATRRRSRLNLGLHTTKYEGQEHVVRVMRGGKEFCIYINGNPRAAQAINGMTNPNTAYNTPVMRFAERVKNFQARAYTSLSPMFIFANLSRDVIMAGTAVAIKENGAYTKQYSKNITKALTTAMLPRLVKKYKAGKLDMNIEEERYFNEFVMNGGETGFTRLLGMEDYKKDLEKKLQKLQGKQSVAGKTFETVSDGVEFMNRSVEDTTRFMVYMTSRQMGRDVRRSIWDAKEITVNFNKKGSGGFFARELSLMYIFFNAAVQSVANFGKLMAKNPGKTTVALAAFSSAGMLVPLLNMTMQALLGDDDELEYWDLPEWVRRNNLVIWLPGGYVTIPLPHELRPFYGMGEATMACILGKAEVGETLEKVALGFSDMLPLDFTGNGGNILVNLMPTISQPIVQVAMNVDYFGKPIYRDNDWNKEDPEWTKAYKGTSTWLVNGTKWLNEISGGNNIKSGYIDLNPAWIEHLFESYTGGMGKTFNKMMKTVSMLWNEDAREVRNVPVVSSFYQTSEERTVDRALNEKYHKALEELESYNHLMRGYKKEAGKGLFEYAKLYSDLVESNKYNRAEIIKYFKKRVDEIEDYLENNKLTPEERTKAENDMRDAKLMMFDELDNVNK